MTDGRNNLPAISTSRSAVATDDGDWCHVCGRRSRHEAEIRWPRNAEHYQDGEVLPPRNVLRICGGCLRSAMNAALEPDAHDAP